MTYGELKTRVLELIFSYSVAGSEIPATYNNQADYTGMIPGLVNQAEMDIATTVKRIPAVKMLSDMSHHPFGRKEHYLLPEDCWMPMLGGLLFDGPCDNRFFGYRVLLGGKVIEAPPELADRLALEYFRYPERVTETTTDSTELDNTPDVHECLVFYVAAHLLEYDDAYRAAIFKNEYTERISRLKEPIWLEAGIIKDAYRL